MAKIIETPSVDETPVVPVTLENILNTESDSDVPTEEANSENQGEDVAVDAPETEEKKSRAKHVAPEGYSSTWVPVDVTEEDALMLRHAAKAQNTTISEMLCALFAPFYQTLRADLQAEAAKFTPKPRVTGIVLDSDEAVTKAQAKISAQEARLAEAKANIEAAIAARAAKNAPVTEGTSE